MTERTRRRTILALFAVSIFALLATTPGPPTARSEASGELYVSSSEPARIEVRFTVTDPTPDEIVRIAVNPTIGYDRQAPIEASAAGEILGHGQPQPQRPDRYGIELDPSACATGCDVLATIDATWRGDAQPGMRVAWTLELEVEYLNRVPAAATAVTASSGAAAPPRWTWLGIGALLAVVAAVVLWLTRPRQPVLRLVLAAGLLVPAAWPLAMLAGYLGQWMAGRLIVGQDSLAMVVAGLLLSIGVVLGIVRAVRGRATVLRVVGWMAALAIGYVWWAIAINIGTYRPHEMIAVTAMLGTSLAAAITAVPIGAAGDVRRTAGVGTSLVMAVQALLVVVAALVAVATFAGFTATLFSARQPDITLLGAVLAAIALAALFMFGWLDWRRGSMRNIFIANAIAVVAAVGLGTIVLLQSESGLLSVGIELRVLAALVMVTVLVGAVGLRVVDPPLAHEQGNGESGQSDEIPRIADEQRGDGLGEGA